MEMTIDKSDIDATPGAWIIESIRNQNHDWMKILSEFIDNAFDAGATRVELDFGDRILTVRDDGGGCADPSMMVTLGHRKSHEQTKLGMYGIGMKEGAMCAGDEVHIATVHKGILRTVSANWAKMIRENNWNIGHSFMKESADTGTTITIKSLIKRSLPKKSSLLTYLSRTYSPAIKSGRQIRLKMSSKQPWEMVAEYPMPNMNPMTTQEVHVRGKTARVTAGIVSPNQEFRERGLIISSSYRVICRNQSIGLGDNPTPGLFGWVELGSGWPLTKMKDDLSDYKEELGNEIYTAIKPIIDAAQNQSEFIEFKYAGDVLTKAMKELALTPIKTRKARRPGTDNKTGTVPFANTGRTHKRAAKTQPGETFSDCDVLKTGFRFSPESAGQEANIARFESRGIIYLNKDNPAIVSSFRNRELFLTHCAYLAAVYMVMFRSQGELPFKGDDEFVGLGADADIERLALRITQMVARVRENELFDVVSVSA